LSIGCFWAALFFYLKKEGRKAKVYFLKKSPADTAGWGEIEFFSGAILIITGQRRIYTLILTAILKFLVWPVRAKRSLRCGILEVKRVGRGDGSD
jgi:hypothetical protein